jgi:hypothetical protein
VTPLPRKIKRTTYGNRAVKYATFPEDLNPFKILKKIKVHKKIKQSVNV